MHDIISLPETILYDIHSLVKPIFYMRLKIVKVFIFTNFNMCLGAYEICLIDFFFKYPQHMLGAEIRKLIFDYPLLS